MLLPLSLKTSKSVALSIVKIDQFYSIKPCTIVNAFGMDEIDSSFILTKESHLLTESNREELKIEFINKIDDFVVNQYYINCATENGTIGYPIQYCPICGKNLNKS